jgi:predicted dehydrogenase/nucleoside-diphosphate-sugar epimerase
VTTKPLRVALVGCGAVSRENLLPVLAGHEGMLLAALVDRDEKRAQELAQAYGVSQVLSDAGALDREHFDAVILATPPAHHAPATLACISKGLHVFVEKPMAITVADAQSMVDAADRAGVTLSVGLYRRFLPSVQLLRALIERREFGRPIAVDAEEGGPYGWPLASLDLLKRSSGGGGVLIDLGSHVIDLVTFVLQARATLDGYQDNDRGGIETDCLLQASLETESGSVPLRLELSRTRELRGSIKIECEHATLELVRANFNEVFVHRHQNAGSGESIQFSAAWTAHTPFVGYEAFRREVDDWVTAISQGTVPVLSGRSVVPVVGLIEDAYRNKTALTEPGDVSVVTPVVGAAHRKRVLVTGAGGFLGGRAVEMLRDRYGWDVVPLVREPKSAARLARWPNEILLGDICSRADMLRAMKGCDAVLHCAVGTSWKPDETRRVTVDGTRVVAEAALAAGVKRLVHISTLNVHQRDGVSLIDESVALQPPPRDSYGQNKLEAERVLATVASNGLSTIVIRPTRIYGPFSRTFTIRPFQALSEGRLAIGGNPDVPANMVYVDNVVAAIARALEAPDRLGGSAYLITDTDQVSLREFYEFFGRQTGLAVRLLPDWRHDAPSETGAAFASRWLSGVKTIARSSELRGIVRRVLDTDPIGTLPRRMWERSPQFQQRMLRRFGADSAIIYRRPPEGGGDDLVYYGEAARVSAAKAERELGFIPELPQAQAMVLTLDWGRYARLLPATADRP